NILFPNLIFSLNHHHLPFHLNLELRGDLFLSIDHLLALILLSPSSSDGNIEKDDENVGAES
ncbi:hypothetical protein EUTSA_v10002952mg, partial [Eutrema salsugineum]